MLRLNERLETLESRKIPNENDLEKEGRYRKVRAHDDEIPP